MALREHVLERRDTRTDLSLFPRLHLGNYQPL